MPTPKPSSPHLKFAQCAIGTRERIWFIAEEADDFRLLQLKGGATGGKWAVRTPDWPLSSLCGVDHGNGQYEVLGLGIDGELLVGSPGKFTESHVDAQRQGPDRYGALRDIRMIGEDVFAAGMSRQVYRRHAGAWTDISEAIRSQPKAATGFNSIDGTAADAVFAVGFHGEVWFYNGLSWRQLDSPTSAALHRVVVLPSGFAVICGVVGVLLQGLPDALTPIRNDVTRDNLYGMTFFKGRLYVASMKSLYVIGPHGLEALDVGLDGPLTYGNLDANDEVMWSVGARHLLTTQDGAVWQRVMCDV